MRASPFVASCGHQMGIQQYTDGEVSIRNGLTGDPIDVTPKVDDPRLGEHHRHGGGAGPHRRRPRGGARHRRHSQRFVSGDGIAQGALIAAIALGVVLTYLGSGVVNFANGTIAMYVAYRLCRAAAEGDLFLPPLPNPMAWSKASPTASSPPTPSTSRTCRATSPRRADAVLAGARTVAGVQRRPRPGDPLADLPPRRPRPRQGRRLRRPVAGAPSDRHPALHADAAEPCSRCPSSTRTRSIWGSSRSPRSSSSSPCSSSASPSSCTSCSDEPASAWRPGRCRERAWRRRARLLARSAGRRQLGTGDDDHWPARDLRGVDQLEHRAADPPGTRRPGAHRRPSAASRRSAGRSSPPSCSVCRSP